MNSTTDTPDVDHLARRLRALMAVGVSSVNARTFIDLVELECVKQRRNPGAATPGEVDTAALAATLRDVVETIPDDDLRMIAPYAFDLSGSALPLKTRLQNAAQKVGRTSEGLRRKPLDRLASETAERLHALNERHCVWLSSGTRAPVSRELALDTIRRYDFYREMAHWIWGVSADLRAVVTPLTEPVEQGETPQDYAESALWRWARFTRTVYHYEDNFHATWVFSTDSTVRAVVDLSHGIDTHNPFSPRDRSWLSIMVADVREQKLDPFVTALQTESRGRRLVQAWDEWLRTCHCRPSLTSPSCDVHWLIDAGERFDHIVREDFNRIVNEYTDEMSDRHLTLPDALA